MRIRPIGHGIVRASLQSQVIYLWLEVAHDVRLLDVERRKEKAFCDEREEIWVKLILAQFIRYNWTG